MKTRVRTALSVFLATGAGSGFLPWAPGTWGTAAAVPLYLLLAPLSPGVYALLLVLLCGLATAVSGAAERHFGCTDPPQVVIDEILGFLITMFMVPPDWRSLIAGFVLFRALDIFKPFPASYINRSVAGGRGIVLDDVVAGVYACGVLHAAARVL